MKITMNATIFLILTTTLLLGPSSSSSSSWQVAAASTADVVDTTTTMTTAETSGSCSANDGDETCSSSTIAGGPDAGDDDDETQQQQEQPSNFCFPDGQCYDSMELANAKYKNNEVYVPLDTPVNYGDPQRVSGAHWKDTMNVITKTKTYMQESVFQNDTAKSYRNDCKCRHELCSFWAGIGECENNPKYMLLHCAPVCQTCHELSFEHRCPYDKHAPTAWSQPGDLSQMFERITTDPYYVETYQPTILSKDPWIVTLENVATEEECHQMIQLGADRGYERSRDVGKKNWDGTFEGVEQSSRTSTNMWCTEECYENELHQNVLRKVENITNIPDENSEYWQFLRYEVGQRYGRHHDYIQFHNQRAQGVRILTVFLYLSDVEEGGGTRFNVLDIEVKPKRGRALLWPSVRNESPHMKDPRTDHEALPVIKGVKYAANAWVHQKNFKEPFAAGCS